MSESRWFYRLLGEEIGPVPLSTLRELVAEGQLSPADEIREDSSTNWRTIANTTDLQPDHSEATVADLESMLDFSASDEEHTAATMDDLDDMLNSGSGAATASDLESMLAPSPTRAKPTPRKAVAPPAVPERAEARWFCRILNQELGPYSFGQLREMATSGELGSLDPVRGERETRWTQALRIPGLFTGIQQGPVKENDFQGALSPQRAAIVVAKWYCQVLDQELGPFDLTQMQGMVDRGELRSTDQVRRDGSEQWLQAQSIGSLTFPPPVAAPPVVVSAAPAKTDATPAPQVSSRPATAPALSPAAPSVAAAAPVAPQAPRPPAMTPVAPRSSAPPPSAPPRRSSSGGGIKLDPKVLAIVAAVILLPLGFYFLMPFLGATLATERNDFEQMVGLWTQISSLNDKEADEAQWKQFAQATRAQSASHHAALKLKTSTPVTQNLIKIYESCLPTIYDGSADERAAAMEQMKTFLTEASKSVK